MQIGMMNNPVHPVEREIERIGQWEFGFVDLTIEGPLALDFDVRAVRDLLDRYHLGIIGHTDPHLPYSYPVPSVREACLRELERCAAMFAELDVAIMNIHPCYQCPPRMKRNLVDLNQEALVPIAKMAGRYGLRLALENLFPPFDSVATFVHVLENVPNLAFHLDVGHANLGEDGPVDFCRGVGTSSWQERCSHATGRREHRMDGGNSRYPGDGLR